VIQQVPPINQPIRKKLSFTNPSENLGIISKLENPTMQVVYNYEE